MSVPPGRTPIVVFSTEALDDIKKIIEWGMNKGYGDPVSFTDGLMDTITDTLTTFPGAARKGRVPGTFELVLAQSKHIAVLIQTPTGCEVLRVLHGSMQFP
jgi:plasmid stabilization system protein ParE